MRTDRRHVDGYVLGLRVPAIAGVRAEVEIVLQQDRKNLHWVSDEPKAWRVLIREDVGDFSQADEDERLARKAIGKDADFPVRVETHPPLSRADVVAIWDRCVTRDGVETVLGEILGPRPWPWDSGRAGT